MAELQCYAVGECLALVHNSCTPAQLAANKLQGVAGEASARSWLTSIGANIVGEQVQAITGKGRRVIDFLVKSGGKLIAIEVKTGKAAYKMSQFVKDQAMHGGARLSSGRVLARNYEGTKQYITTILMYF